jgi:hypothetical protein
VLVMILPTGPMDKLEHAWRIVGGCEVWCEGVPSGMKSLQRWLLPPVTKPGADLYAVSSCACCVYMGLS